MEIKRVRDSVIDENAYVVLLDNGALVIDPGFDYHNVKSELRGKPCVAVLLTHAHIDHIRATTQFQNDGAKVYLHKDDIKLIEGKGNLSNLFGVSFEPFTPDVVLHGGEVLKFEDVEIEVMSTPGHTDGCVCYKLGDVIFSGDTLFYESVGRTDFESGSASKLHNSISNVLFVLPEDCKVLPGHSCETTIGHEKKYNPYV